MRDFTIALTLTIALAGCAAAAPQSAALSSASKPVSPTAPQLAGTQWRFVALHGQSIPDEVHATLRFDDKGRASGRAGCNSYGGLFLAGGDGALHFEQMLSTKMACLQPAGAMGVERGVMDVLDHTAHARVENAEMTLLDVTGQPLATLKSDNASQ